MPKSVPYITVAATVLPAGFGGYFRPSDGRSDMGWKVDATDWPTGESWPLSRR